MTENNGVPASPSGHQPSASATSADAPVSSQSGVPNADVSAREAALVEAVGRALSNLGTEDGYFPSIGAPNTRRLIAAYRAYGLPIEFGRCLKW